MSQLAVMVTMGTPTESRQERVRCATLPGGTILYTHYGGIGDTWQSWSAAEKLTLFSN